MGFTIFRLPCFTRTILSAQLALMPFRRYRSYLPQSNNPSRLANNRRTGRFRRLLPPHRTPQNPPVSFSNRVAAARNHPPDRIGFGGHQTGLPQWRFYPRPHGRQPARVGLSACDCARKNAMIIFGACAAKRFAVQGCWAKARLLTGRIGENG